MSIKNKKIIITIKHDSKTINNIKYIIMTLKALFTTILKIFI